MVIVISAYTEGQPREVEETYDPRELDIELVDLKFLEKLQMTGEVLREPTTVSFKGRLTSRVRRICGKTLQEVDEPLDIPFSFYYEIGERETIETLDDIREAVLIEQPMVYYAPGTEHIKVEYEDKIPDKKNSQTNSNEGNLREKLKKLRDRFKEE